eukprot:5871378-Lingulodinium_polyedra.AAC.1
MEFHRPIVADAEHVARFYMGQGGDQRGRRPNRGGPARYLPLLRPLRRAVPSRGPRVRHPAGRRR